MKIVSGCLAGIKCNFKGEAKPCQKVIELVKKGEAIPVCPEQLGGLSTPRTPSEIQGMSGEYVLDGKCTVVNRDGIDVTKQFVKGAYEVLKIAQSLGIKEYIGVQKSPSCGCGKTYDGTFSKTLIDGDGVTVALLKRNGVSVKIAYNSYNKSY